MGAVLSWFCSNQKPYAVVYVWDKNSNDSGHVAVEADNLYISSWLTELKLKNELERIKKMPILKKISKFGHCYRSDPCLILFRACPIEVLLEKPMKCILVGKVKEHDPFDYDDDVRNYISRPCDHVYHIPCDVSKIKEWRREEEKRGYNLFRHHCYDAAVDALRAGGAQLHDKMTPSSPAGMVDICKKLGRMRSKL